MTFVDVGSNVLGGYEGFASDDGNDMEFPTTYSQRLDISPDEIMETRSRAGDRRNASSKSKRKWRGQSIETAHILRNVIEYDNE